jgi:hypothetical protein
MSCSKEYEGVFEQSPDERTRDVLKEYKDILVSSENGWIVDYYPNPEILGGFTFLFKFDEKGTVKMNWGYRNQDDDQALYSLKMVEAPILSFDTYSIFTKMRDPELGVWGKGFGGDNEFIIDKISPTKDTIYLRERLGTHDPMILVKASAKAWTDIKNYPEMCNVLTKMEDKVVPYYYNLTVEGWSSPVTMTYYDDQQQVNLFYKENGKDTIVSMGINFTGDGFQLHHALERNGIKVRSFRYDAALGQHIVADKGVKGSFQHATTCASVIKGAAKKFFGPGNFGTDSKGASPKLMAAFENLNPDSKLRDFDYRAYGGDWFTDFTVYFEDWTNITMSIAKYEITSENTVVLHFGSYPDSESSDYYDGLAGKLMASEVGQKFYNLLYSPKGWTVVPISFIEYGAQCAFVSNEDPEMYIIF